MDYLLEFMQRDDVRALATRFLEHSKAVQGISIDLDDFWLTAWRWRNTLPPPEFEARLRWHARHYDYFGYWPTGCPDESRDEFIAYPYGVDPGWQPPFWDAYCHSQGMREEPFLITVVLRPTSYPGTVYELREMNTEGLRVRFEARPMARLYTNPKGSVSPLVGGVSVSSPSGPPGTLGGVLTDAQGTRYGLTCSHVLAQGDEAHQPSPKDNRKAATPIGVCLESAPLQTHLPPLNPYDPSINTVDAALVELDDGVAADLEVLGVGVLSGTASKSNAHPNTSVDISGKEAGFRALYIGGATMVHEFDFNGAKYGYANLFELKRASRFHAITGSLRHPVNAGDSGAWVLQAGAHGSEWLGVVVAGDGAYGYAIPAEFIQDWISRTPAGSLDVL